MRSQPSWAGSLAYSNFDDVDPNALCYPINTAHPVRVDSNAVSYPTNATDPGDPQSGRPGAPVSSRFRR
jgi:hypothetical protein